MTEAEWLAATDPEPMLDYLRDNASERNLLLFAVACCRRIWLRLPISVKETVVVVERYIDAKTKKPGFHECWTLARQVRGEVAETIVRGLMYQDGFNWFSNYSQAAQAVAATCSDLSGTKEWSKQAALLRCIFPFHPITLDPSWLTSTVVSLANQMYDSKDFSAMPILADALMDASCDNEAMLNHCRGPGAHVRGCWVLDLLTNRE